MDLATLVHQYHDAFMARFGKTLLPDQRKALDAILRCRTPAAGELYVQCPDCQHGQWRPLSCGNRHCPRCQNHLTSLWIDKQREKLLPVPYFMVTFTLPYQLRSLAYRHQKANNAPKKWVVHCDHMGTGAPALKYLARYLYRGVIGEKNIVANANGEVTFRYRDSATRAMQKRTLKGEEFLRLLIQHVLPNGFRRLREYGFLHGNAKKIRMLVQLVLHVVIRPQPPRPRPVFACPHCDQAMRIVPFRNDYRHPR